MSVLSQNKNNRIFKYSNSFTFEGNYYEESFYYKILDFNYQGLLLDQVVIQKIYFIEEYLNDNPHFSKLTFNHPNIPVWLSRDLEIWKKCY